MIRYVDYGCSEFIDHLSAVFTINPGKAYGTAVSMKSITKLQYVVCMYCILYYFEKYFLIPTVR